MSVEIKIKVVRAVLVKRKGYSDHLNVELDANPTFPTERGNPSFTVRVMQGRGETWARSFLGPTVDIEIVDTEKLNAP